MKKNKNGQIELTKEQLQRMLDDAYSQGYADAKGRCDTITYPSNSDRSSYSTSVTFKDGSYKTYTTSV